MEHRRHTSLLTIANFIAALAVLIIIGEWLDRLFWQRVPRLLGISSQTLGLVALTGWLLVQGYLKFLRPGHDKVDIPTLQAESRKSDVDR